MTVDERKIWLKTVPFHEEEKLVFEIPALFVGWQHSLHSVQPQHSQLPLSYITW